MGIARNENGQELIKDYLFYLSSAYLMDAILRGELPEIAIQLAFRNPAFQTPFSKLIQDLQFFSLLSKAQQVLFIIECLRELVQQSTKEREEYLHQLAAEEKYEYEEFIKHFNEILTVYNQNIDELIKQQTIELVQLQINHLNKLISTLNTMIKLVDTRIALLTQRLTIIEQKMAENITASNDLFLQILARNTKDMQIRFSDGTSMIVSNTEVMAYATQYTKKNPNRLFNLNEFLPIYLGAVEKKAEQFKKILGPSELAQLDDYVSHNQSEAKKDSGFKKYENYEKIHAELAAKYEEVDNELQACHLEKETLVAQLETTIAALDQYQQILDNPSTPIDQQISISLDSFGEPAIDIDALASQIDPSLLIDDDLDSSQGIDTAAIMHSIGASPSLSDDDIAAIEPEFDAPSNTAAAPKSTRAKPAVSNKSTQEDEPHDSPRITGK